MRVLLISPNREQLPDPVFPLGLAYVSSALIGAGHDVRALDLLFSDDTEAEIERTVKDYDPEVIGISIRNVDDVSYPKRHSYTAEYRSVVSCLRRLTKAPIVLGGSGFTIMPEEFMRELGADFGIRGEGERAFPELLGRLGGKPGVIHARRVNALDETVPYRGLFDADAYYRLGGMLNIQTKRGCPFGCIYCTYPKVEGRRVRLRDPIRVADELEKVVSETGVKHFFFVDSIFNYPPSHASAVCREIIKRKIGVRWSCYGIPSAMTPELAGLMRRAGCSGVEFGVDSLNDEALVMLGKSFDYGKIKKAGEICRSAGIKFCLFLFVGAPGDTLERVRENFGRLDELSPDAAVIMAGIRVFPRTRLEAIMKKENGNLRAGLEPLFYVSPEVLENIDDIVQEASRRKKWTLPGFEVKLSERLRRRIRESGMKGSLWEGLTERFG